jgi:DNA-binding response OmpR family regulator
MADEHDPIFPSLEAARLPTVSDADVRHPILVVDDDPHLREALARILQSEGHRVLTAADGPTALELTKTHAPSLLVLDYMMPGMDGGALLGALREELRERTPPTLLLTASGGSQERADEIGAVMGLEKPFNVPELLEAVECHRRKTARRRD